MVYLNDLGIINALGDDKNSVIGALFKNQTGVTESKNLISGRKTLVGSVKSNLPLIPSNLSEYDCRNNRMLLHACLQIQPTIEQIITKYGQNRVGIVLGTSTSGIDNGEKAFIYNEENGHFPEEYSYKQQETGGISNFLKAYLGLKGVSYTISTACSSSGKAFASAKRLIEQNICDAVIVGGCDTLCQLTLNGFDCLESISENVCKPFSIDRNGINIGEGAALFILSKEPSEISLTGVGESSDGYHITAPDPTGNGARLAMLQALEMAKLSSKDIGYLNLHGTATIKNDEMEREAVLNTFNNYLLPCSSTKNLTGHTLGAAGATELGLCWLLLSTKYNPNRILPKQYDTKENLIPDMEIIMNSISWTSPYFMSNSFAFGGSNVSVIIGSKQYV
ncbi:beta-ketoacyl-[acyl-carrier-protein] synthase family protein [Pseudofrancisella aestuarii]|uniref:Beta-ketoacyl-[acyl-carrier-protein] synthase family protein n=1 Tax=Pseudofrancisella aestuarii TaxID=2670347 RepID=A0ABV9T957_9GAMM|nr:beta-ketoacyl-[acyl-carrier-protein] synthase family protein [Pseudofrancisella aestuarii]